MVRPAIVMVLLALLTGCTQSTRVSNNPALVATPQALMVHVAKQMQTCWFKAKDPAVRPYRLSSEVNSFSGKPRVLLVPRNNPNGLPKLVAQAERVAGRNQFTAFGPLLQTNQGPRLNAAMRKWARGQKTC